MRTLAIIVALRQHIITECLKASGGQLFPCVKQSVYACVITADGRAYYGANWMTASDVTICPRILANTTSYELCATVCGQGTEFHAERQAMWSVYYDGADLTGAEMFITGHTYCCDTCRAAMFAEGITYAASLDSGKYYERGVDTMKETLPAPPEEVIVETWICDSCGTVCFCFEPQFTVDGEDCDTCVCSCCADEQNELCHGNYYERGSHYINFDDHVSAMEWVITEHARLVKLYAHGQTEYCDVYHDGTELYSWTKKQRHTYNIYGEPTFVYDEYKHHEGVVIEWRGKEVGINKGAFTAIELRPYVMPIIPFLDELDLDF